MQVCPLLNHHYVLDNWDLSTKKGKLKRLKVVIILVKTVCY